MTRTECARQRRVYRPRTARLTRNGGATFFYAPPSIGRGQPCLCIISTAHVPVVRKVDPASTRTSTTPSAAYWCSSWQPTGVRLQLCASTVHQISGPPWSNTDTGARGRSGRGAECPSHEQSCCRGRAHVRYSPETRRSRTASATSVQCQLLTCAAHQLQYPGCSHTSATVERYVDVPGQLALLHLNRRTKCRMAWFTWPGCECIG